MEFLRLLLQQADIDVNERTDEVRSYIWFYLKLFTIHTTPLLLACMTHQGYNSTCVPINVLLAAGADPNAQVSKCAHSKKKKKKKRPSLRYQGRSCHDYRL